ncbi:MAG TPA: hypothetical protein VHC69_21395 [Polyangiaceae bacterium]|nr:hypothetical protein [Polyangiaceae bacterium]
MLLFVRTTRSKGDASNVSNLGQLMRQVEMSNLMSDVACHAAAAAQRVRHYEAAYPDLKRRSGERERLQILKLFEAGPINQSPRVNYLRSQAFRDDREIDWIVGLKADLTAPLNRRFLRASLEAPR